MSIQGDATMSPITPALSQQEWERLDATNEIRLPIRGGVRRDALMDLSIWNYGTVTVERESLAALIAIANDTLHPDDARRVKRAHVEMLLTLANGSLRRMATLGADRVSEVPGVGPAKAQTLGVIFEIGRRYMAEVREENLSVRSPRDVVAIMAPKMEDLGVEEMHVLALDAQHHIERDILITRGILNSSLVHPREVFREAIAERAAAIILVHNHPSGDPTPSADDRNVTDQMITAGRLLDIPVHDHVIIGRGRYTSFAEAGLL